MLDHRRRSVGSSRRELLGAAPLTAALAAAAPALAAESAGKGPGLDAARATIANVTRITSPDGVQELYQVRLGGADQWVSVRGRDRRNPILLYVHGGPGAPEMPLAWIFQGGWEDYFTVVQWDQRGAGKSYGAEPPEKIVPTLTADRIVADGGELLAHLSAKYGARRIVVLGQSWGSFVGLRMALEYPDRVAAYVGTGQIVNFREAECLGYEWVLGRAIAEGNETAVRELRSLAPYPEPDGSVPVPKIDLQRKWSVHYGGLQYGRSAYDYYWASARLSPDYEPEDVANIGRGSEISLVPLIGDLSEADFSGVRSTPFPIVFLLGRHDHTTPNPPVERWLKRLKAPVKRLVWFENSAHLPPIEEPGRFLVSLVQHVRPLAAARS